MSDREPRPAASWLTPPYGGRRGDLRLLCLPFAGMGPSVFRDWHRDLPPAVEVRGVRLPGRESRFGEPAIGEMEPLADALAAAIAPSLDRPWAVYGHSMGALVAFETVRRLRDRGVGEPEVLFVGAMRAPHLPDRYPPLWELPADAFRDELRERYGLVNEALDHPEILEALLPALRADSRVCDTYRHRPGEPLGCRLVAYGSRGDSHITEEEIAGWGEHTTGPFRHETLGGDHFFVTSARDELLASLDRHLREVLGEGR